MDTSQHTAASDTDTEVLQSLPRSVVVDLGAETHAGRVRPDNEDHYLVIRFGRALEPLMTNLPAGLLPDQFSETGYGMLVADGMGGAAAGEVASRAAITALLDLVLATPDWVMRLGGSLTEEVLTRMARRYEQVNAAVAVQALGDAGLSGMGTTMTVACSVGSDLVVAHAGDSRAYLVRDGRLQRLTRDHTVAQELADAGALAPGEVQGHPLRHVLTVALGRMTTEVRADVRHLRLRDGDQVLLCTDGLTDMVEEGAIEAVLREAGSAAVACHALVEAALAGGGRDNVTVVLARYRIAE
jgi:PPM family protein phosphatase